VPTPLDHSVAIGQWGNLMIEFDQQNDAGPSVFHDLFPEGSGRYGLHHVALIAKDFHMAVAECVAAGFPIACEGQVNGMPFAMVDAASAYGHMIELYPPAQFLLDLYDFVKKESRGFTGQDVVRSLPST